MHAFTSKQTAPTLSAIAILGFIAYLFAQHNRVFPYHDDWGYATLSYVGEQTGFTGQNFNLTQMLSFLCGEYMNWSGRIVAFFVQINLFKLGIEYVRLAQVGIIFSIIFLAIKISPQKNFIHPLTIVPIVYFLSLPQYSSVGGLYWFSASIAYVWGIPLFLSAARLIQKRSALDITSTILLSCAAGFHEQMSFAVSAFLVSYIALSTFYGLDTNRVFRDLKLTSPVFAIALITIFAPGNFNRKNVSTFPSENLTDTLTLNAESLANWIFVHQEARTILALLSASFIFLLVLLIRSSPNKPKALAVLLSSLLLLGISYSLSLLAFFAAALLLYGALLFHLRKPCRFDLIALSIYVGAITSLTILLAAPGVAGRSLLTFFFLMIIPVTFIFVQAFRAGLGTAVYATILATLPFAISNAGSIYSGYKSNFEANSVNHAKLVAASHELNYEGSPRNSIDLLKLNNPRYAEQMPYDKPQIEKWIKKYYSLPEDFSLVWNDNR